MNRRQRRLLRRYTGQPEFPILSALFRLEITAGWFWIACFVALCLKAAGVF